MSTDTINVSPGPLMRLHRACPFTIQGMRFRTSQRVIGDVTAVTLRIGTVAATALIEQALTLDDTDEDDPSWYCTLTAVQAALAASSGYEYVFVNQDGAVMRYGPCSVVDHPRAV